MKTNSLLIIDGENLLHRAYHKFIKFKSADGMPTGAIYGFLKILHSNMFRFGPEYVIITFDNGRSKHRTKILPEYKSGRKKLGMDYDSLQLQKKVIMKILKRLNVPYVFDKKFVNHYEADDYIALFTNLFKGDITILSSDKDFHQRINKRVKVMSPSKDVLISEANCKKLTGYNPNQCVDYLSMVGDESDAIPGYRGIGEKKGVAFLEKYGNILPFLESNKEEPGVNKQLLKEVYLKNQMLIDLEFFISTNKLKKADIPVVYGKKVNTDKLNLLFNKYTLSSFQSNEFINPFKQLSVWKINK